MSTLPTGNEGLPRFGDQSENIIEPSSGQKDAGWVGGERPPPGTMNWLHYLTYIWLVLVDAIMRAKRVWVLEPWNFVIANAVANGWTAGGTLTTTVENPTSTMRHRFVKVAGQAIADDVGFLVSYPIHYFNTDSEVWMEWEQYVTTYGAAATYRFEVGFLFASGATHVILVRKTEAHANWHLYITDATGSTNEDTGIEATVATLYRMRLEYSGPNGDGTDARVQLFIDGVLVKTVTNTNVPRGTTGSILIRSAVNDAGDANGDFYVGPIAYSTEDAA